MKLNPFESKNFRKPMKIYPVGPLHVVNGLTDTLTYDGYSTLIIFVDEQGRRVF